MGLDFQIYGIRSEADIWYKKYMKVADVCNEADIKVPIEVEKYLADYTFALDLEGSITQETLKGCKLYRLDLDKVPKDVRTIEIYISN